MLVQGGSLGTITDTRLQAGAQSTSATAFPSEATTAEPSVVSVDYAKIILQMQQYDINIRYSKTYIPVYYDYKYSINEFTRCKRYFFTSCN